MSAVLSHLCATDARIARIVDGMEAVAFRAEAAFAAIDTSPAAEARFQEAMARFRGVTTSKDPSQ